MNSAEKKLFLQKLENETDDQIQSTLHYYRENGDIELLPNVLELLASDRSDMVKETIIELCGDIKTQEAANIAFDYMAQTKNANIRKALLSSLWQAGIDISDRAEKIVEIMLACTDFETTFDAFTLLENCAIEISQETASKLHDIVKNAEGKAADYKRGILQAAREHLLQISLGKKVERAF